MRLHDRPVRDLSCLLANLQEQHPWCRKKQDKIDTATTDDSDIGEQWSWVALCRTSTLTIAWHVGKRDAASADAIVADTRLRLVVMPQITTDGLVLYEAPILRYFGYAVGCCPTIKNFSAKGAGRMGRRSTPCLTAWTSSRSASCTGRPTWTRRRRTPSSPRT
ncbi:MAG: hypothetical protein QM820_54150 [Minicystis sp.]